MGKGRSLLAIGLLLTSWACGGDDGDQAAEQTGSAGQPGSSGAGGKGGSGGKVGDAGKGGSGGQTSAGGAAGASAGASAAGASAAGASAAGAAGDAGASAAGAGGEGQAGAGGSAGAAGSAAGGSAGGPGEKTFFAIIGDYGVDSGNEAVVAEMVKEAKPDFVITLGDNNYPDGQAKTIDAHIGQYYAEFIAPYKGDYGPGATENRFFPSAGNHDWNTGSLDAYLDYFELPGNERYYEFKRGPVHFFAIDSDSHEPDGTSATSKQAQWLKAKLEASTSPFKVVYFHHPPYSSGSHGNSTKMQWPFAAWGASAVLAGHDHTYERFTIDGIPYIVNGLGGAGLYDFDVVKPESEVRFNSAHGAMFAEATAEKLVLRARSVKNDLIDEVTVLPGGTIVPPSPPLVGKGASWRYLDASAAPDGWKQPAFDDGAWETGEAPLGYGETDLGTTIGYGGNPDKKRITAYFRKTFTYDGSAPLSLTYALRRDDGAVIYLNGVEVLRSNMPQGSVVDATAASSTVGGADEDTFLKGALDPGQLTSGTNVLAVEVHQADAASSDLIFDFELRASTP